MDDEHESRGGGFIIVACMGLVILAVVMLTISGNQPQTETTSFHTHTTS